MGHWGGSAGIMGAPKHTLAHSSPGSAQLSPQVYRGKNGGRDLNSPRPQAEGRGQSIEQCCPGPQEPLEPTQGGGQTAASH